MNKNCVRIYSVIFFICTMLVCAMQYQARAAEQPQIYEYQLKTAFIYNFIKFTNWPQNRATASDQSTTQTPLLLTTVGHNNLNNSLKALKGKTASGRKIVYYHSNDISWDDINSCQVLFVAFDNLDQCIPTIMAVTGKPILTISDTPGFAEHGGCIEFCVHEGKLRFIINRTAIEKQGLELSYKVYVLALKVLGEE